MFKCRVMFEDLDDVDWVDIEGAYGSAKDVPKWLRNLASRDPKRRKEGQYWIEASLLHQGSVYEASVAAIPFLVELALEPKTQERPWILMTLVGMAGAYRKQTQFWGIPFEQLEERLKQEWPDELFRCYYAVEPETAQLATLLSDPDVEVRCATAFLLSQFSRMRYQNTPLLEAALAAESEPGAQMSMKYALSLLDHYQGDEARWEQFAPDLSLDPNVDPTRSATAAYCLFHYPKAAESVELRRIVVDLLERAMTASSPTSVLPEVPWEDGSLVNMLNSAAEEISDTATRVYMAERLLPVLDRIQEKESWAKELAELALLRVYPGSTTIAPPEGGWPNGEATPPALKKLALKVLENPKLFSPGLLNAFSGDGLKDDVDELFAFFGVAAPDSALDVEIEHEGETVTVRSLLPRLTAGGKGSPITKSYGNMKVTFTPGDSGDDKDDFKLPLAAFQGRPDALRIAFALASRGVAAANELSVQAFEENGSHALEEAALLAESIKADGLPITVTTRGTAVHHGGAFQLLVLSAKHCEEQQAVPPESLDPLVRLVFYADDAGFEATCLYLGLLPQDRRDEIIEAWAADDWDDRLSGERLSGSPSSQQKRALASLMSEQKGAGLLADDGAEDDDDEDEDEQSAATGGLVSTIAAFFKKLLGGD